jgi:multidrug efflux pump subunit AcrA (membrane-fusion protein)
MTSQYSKIGPLFLWQVLTLVAVLVVTGGVTYAGLDMRSSASGGIGEEEQLVLARVGDLINEVSTNGTIVFPLEEVVQFVPAGIVGEVLVEVGDNVQTGQALARLDVVSIAALEKTVAQARVTLRNAGNDLADSLSEGGLSTKGLELSLAQRAWDRKIETAQTAADDAQSAYSTVLSKWLGVKVTPAELVQSPTTLMDTFDVDLDVIYAPDRDYINVVTSDPRVVPQNDPLTRWDESIVYAWLSLFPTYLTGTCDGQGLPTQYVCVRAEIDAAWNALDLARDTTDTARVDAATALAKLTVEDELDIAVLEAVVHNAELALVTALAELEGATLPSPITGLVAGVDMKASDSARANAVGIVVVDVSVVEIEGTVDEIDVLSISPGVVADVTMTALPGQTLTGTVTEIGAPTNQQGVVTFPIQVRLEVPPGVQLFEGLSATANIITSQQLGVLLVPTAAIQGSFIQPFVRVISTEGVDERPVELGASDDFWVVVNDGLVEGEQVAMPAPSASDSGFGSFTGGDRQALRALIQGGGGGRGGRNGGG